MGKQLWQGIEIRPRQATELKPGYLEVSPLGDPFVEVLEPETEEQIHRMFWLDQRKMLLPGQYEVKFGNLLWPGLVEVRAGETTRLRTGRLDIKSKLGAMYVRVLDKQGQEVLETSSRRIALPSGSLCDGDRQPKFFKSLTDEQRRISFELDADKVLAVPIE
jgi:hypothetical protein